VSSDGKGLVSQAGAVVLGEPMQVTGLAAACRGAWPGGGHCAGLRPGSRSSRTWPRRSPRRDCLADIAVLQEQQSAAAVH
jgi:hypothetical protein